MEESITNFGKSLASFCNHLQNNCDALKQSVDRRPIPLDSASSTFLQSLNRRVSSISTDLSLLESMSLGTVSFEELLGHVNEVYKKNESDILELQKHLLGTGYVPDLEADDGDDIYNHVTTYEFSSELSCPMDGSDLPLSNQRSVSITKSATPTHSFGDDLLLDDSLSLRNAGLSDVCLATLASGTGVFDDAYTDLHTPEKFSEKSLDSEFSSQSVVQRFGASKDKTLIDCESGEDDDNFIFEKVVTPLVNINLSKDDYESLPSYMKDLVPWEDLCAAVEKINSWQDTKGKGKNYICQDEISSMNLGPKARSFLLALVRMKRVVVETNDNQISYKIL